MDKQLQESLSEKAKEKDAQSEVNTMTTKEEETTQTPLEVSYNKFEQLSCYQEVKVPQVEAKTQCLAHRHVLSYCLL